MDGRHTVRHSRVLETCRITNYNAKYRELSVQGCDKGEHRRVADSRAVSDFSVLFKVKCHNTRLTWKQLGVDYGLVAKPDDSPPPSDTLLS